MGLLESIDINFNVTNYGSYQELISIKWLNLTEFANPGDSGSLYYILDQTNHYYVPIGIHVASDKKNKISYGIRIDKIFDELYTKKGTLILCTDPKECL
jgi:hypothetical protein